MNYRLFTRNGVNVELHSSISEPAEEVTEPPSDSSWASKPTDETLLGSPAEPSPDEIECLAFDAFLTARAERSRQSTVTCRADEAPSLAHLTPALAFISETSFAKLP